MFNGLDLKKSKHKAKDKSKTSRKPSMDVAKENGDKKNGKIHAGIPSKKH